MFKLLIDKFNPQAHPDPQINDEALPPNAVLPMNGLPTQNTGDPLALIQDSIDSAVERLKESEFDYVKNRWKADITNIEDTLESVNHLLRKSTLPTNRHRREAARFFREPVIQFAKVTLPIIKLSRLFFAKLTKRGLNQARLPFLTEISSGQLESLAEVAGSVDEDLLQLIRRLRLIDVHLEAAARTRELTPIAKKVVSRFESAIFLVLLYLVPVIPATGNVASQDYFKSWLATWNHSMILAHDNLERAAKLLANPPG
ncbi:hypothetical protein PtA15_1A491 [Puccinia triticina]|uniref:Uncharacterized protein n=1 Tax=Puccinia triticina TaxID=208348 RepID=A0ABY7CB51_9BASI|nr:uncharacterized protein PtA15_1A491 [Puccinia triticina]WAQ81152.1 hypothetical protein PtA15_1A491 [Puccinia triticina]